MNNLFFYILYKNIKLVVKIERLLDEDRKDLSLLKKTEKEIIIINRF